MFLRAYRGTALACQNVAPDFFIERGGTLDHLEDLVFGELFGGRIDDGVVSDGLVLIGKSLGNGAGRTHIVGIHLRHVGTAQEVEEGFCIGLVLGVLEDDGGVIPDVGAGVGDGIGEGIVLLADDADIAGPDDSQRYLSFFSAPSRAIILSLTSSPV